MSQYENLMESMDAMSEADTKVGEFECLLVSKADFSYYVLCYEASY